MDCKRPENEHKTAHKGRGRRNVLIFGFWILKKIVIDSCSNYCQVNKSQQRYNLIESEHMPIEMIEIIIIITTLFAGICTSKCKKYVHFYFESNRKSKVKGEKNRKK